MRQPRIAKDLPAHVKKPQPWLRDKNHLEFVRTLPCLACGGRRCPCEAAHVRLRTDGAAGRKPGDNYVVPLCPNFCQIVGCHTVQHRLGEASFWAALMMRGITDPWTVAERLYRISGDLELGYRAIQHARPGLLTASMEI